MSDHLFPVSFFDPRRWTEHDAEAVAWTEADGTIAVVRDPVASGVTGRGWVSRPGRPASYEDLPAEVVAFCRSIAPPIKHPPMRHDKASSVDLWANYYDQLENDDDY
jgi:hypothetical protein